MVGWLLVSDSSTRLVVSLRPVRRLLSGRLLVAELGRLSDLGRGQAADKVWLVSWLVVERWSVIWSVEAHKRAE